MSSHLIKAIGITLRDEAAPFDFQLEAGEIVGLAGLDGHGQEAFLRTLAGLDSPVAGSVYANATEHVLNGPHDAFREGIVYLARDRKGEGIFPPLSILDNFRMLTLPSLGRFGFLSRRRALDLFSTYVDRLSIVLPGPNAPITSLSGGNQQKVLIARLLAASPKVLLLNDPTRGVDHPTRLALYALFEEVAADSGVGIVVLSTEIDEIISHAHRALVFRGGTVFTELPSGSVTRDNILAGMFGVESGEQR